LFQINDSGFNKSKINLLIVKIVREVLCEINYIKTIL
jgi:hypothetical protein